MRKIKKCIENGVSTTVSEFDREGKILLENITFKPMDLPECLTGKDTAVYASPVPEPVSFKYNYDDKGNLASKTRIHNGEEIDIEKYIYDNNGNCVTEITLIGEEQNTVNMYYNEDNKIIKRSCLDGSETVYEYNSDGNLVCVKSLNVLPNNCISRSGKSTYTTSVSMIYNDKGLVIGESKIYDGEDQGSIIHEYDENDNIIKTTHISGSETIYEYDENGNCVHIKDYLAPEEEEFEVADDITMTYDEEGNMLTRNSKYEGLTTFEYEFYNEE